MKIPVERNINRKRDTFFSTSSFLGKNAAAFPAAAFPASSESACEKRLPREVADFFLLQILLVPQKSPMHFFSCYQSV